MSCYQNDTLFLVFFPSPFSHAHQVLVQLAILTNSVRLLRETGVSSNIFTRKVEGIC